MDHTKNTIEELAFAISSSKAALAELYKENGTWQTLKGRDIDVSFKTDNMRWIRDESKKLSTLEYEMKCACALRRSGFTIGDRVKIRAPFIGRAQDGRELFGSDSVTNLTGKILRISGDGADFLLRFDGPAQREDYAPAPRAELCSNDAH